MNINTIDLNLFLVFRAVFATRSVTAAGERLSMTQSAVSNALKRLRDRFNDPLFVRTPAGMVPTAMATQLIGLVEEGLTSFTRAIDRARTFEPLTSDRLFRIAINDIGHLVMIPKLVAGLREAAPAIRLETVGTSTAQEARQLLLAGEIDLALGSWGPMGTSFHQQKLFEDSFSVLMTAKHPIRSKTLSVDDYLSAQHVAYRPSGASNDALQAALVREGVLDRRNVVVTAAHSLGLSAIVANSDLLLTVPCRLAEAMRESTPTLRIAALPFEVAPFSVWQQWHERFHTDGGLCWLRELLLGLFSELPIPGQHDAAPIHQTNAPNHRIRLDSAAAST
jgi:DNA-binding transcriptional LysR family regulator